MSSYMATWQRRSIWSNHLGLLLKESLDWYAGYAAHYMARSSPLEFGLAGLVPWFKSLVRVGLQQITRFSIIIRVQGSAFICLFMWMTLLSQAMIKMVFKG